MHSIALSVDNVTNTVLVKFSDVNLVLKDQFEVFVLVVFLVGLYSPC